MNNKKYKFFWGSSPFSNWHICSFTIDGRTFNCGEQYMMFKKAVIMNDLETAELIMREKFPRRQKELGRQVKNYNESLWNSVRYNVVKEGLRQKFAQNPQLKQYLMSFRDHEIVEASPYDSIWGIGFSKEDALNNIDRWGKNLLGNILTDLMNEFWIEALSKFLHEDCWMSFADRIINTDEPFDQMVKRWKKNCIMPYEELSEEEKDKDRAFAIKLMNYLNQICYTQ